MKRKRAMRASGAIIAVLLRLAVKAAKEARRKRSQSRKERLRATLEGELYGVQQALAELPDDASAEEVRSLFIEHRRLKLELAALG